MAGGSRDQRESPALQHHTAPILITMSFTQYEFRPFQQSQTPLNPILGHMFDRPHFNGVSFHFSLQHGQDANE